MIKDKHNLLIIDKSNKLIAGYKLVHTRSVQSYFGPEKFENISKTI